MRQNWPSSLLFWHLKIFPGRRRLFLKGIPPPLRSNPRQEPAFSYWENIFWLMKKIKIFVVDLLQDLLPHGLTKHLYQSWSLHDNLFHGCWEIGKTWHFVKKGPDLLIWSYEHWHIVNVLNKILHKVNHLATLYLQNLPRFSHLNLRFQKTWISENCMWKISFQTVKFLESP